MSKGSPIVICTWYDHMIVQSNLAIRNGLIRNKLVLRNHFPWPICHLLYKNKELLALRNNFRATKKFLIAKFDCSMQSSASPQVHFCYQKAIGPLLSSASPAFGPPPRFRRPCSLLFQPLLWVLQWGERISKNAFSYTSNGQLIIGKKPQWT